MAEPYRPRIVDEELAVRLGSAGAVLIEGPRACGKTATGRRQAASEVLLDVDAGLRQAAELEPGLVLGGPTPRLIDEWQSAPAIWNHVRRAVDMGGGPGRFVLTGSAVPPDDTTRHTGAGRVSRLPMRPMSLFESGHSTGAMSLGAMLRSESVPAQPGRTTVADLVELVCRGGWPLCHNMDTDDAQDFIGDYLDELARSEVSAVDGVRRDPAAVARLLVSLARNISTEATMSTLSSDAGGGQPIDPRTTASYLSALERLFVVEDVPAWGPQLRSRSRLRGAPKRQLVDPSLAAAALSADPGRLLADLETLGFLFESLCVRDLRVYCQMMRAELSHYRDNTGLEVDTIIRQRNGEWMAAEIKLGGRAAVEAAAASLVKLRDDRIDPTRVGDPRRLVVITATGFAYERTDGVAVAPITALGP